MSLATDVNDKVTAIGPKVDSIVALLADLKAQVTALQANQANPADEAALQAAAAGLDAIDAKLG